MPGTIQGLREPNIDSTPDGSSFWAKYWNQSVGVSQAITDDPGGFIADILTFPVSTPVLYKRLTNASQQLAASDAAQTNNAPGFLDGFKREIGSVTDNVTETAKTVAKSAGSIVGALLPWWVWAILGIAALAWLVTVVSPYLRRSST